MLPDGIGGAITEALTRAGAQVTLTHTGNPEHTAAVDALVRGIQEQGGSAQGNPDEYHSPTTVRL